MDSEDGQLFIKNLAYFVRTHERALANALQLQRQKPRHGREQTGAVTSSGPPPSSTTTSLAEALSRPYFAFTSKKIKRAKLTLTPHHLFYLLSKFEDLGVDVGPMNVRIEDLHSNTVPSAYMSFLGHAPKSRGKQSDADSLRSVSSVRSVMSSMSSVWSALTSSAAKAEKQMAQHRDDLKYLYSCFTKIPALRLSPDHRARLISGFEEFPFDTAVPLFAFKNVSSLEICDIDFRQFHGWDRMSEQLHSLTVKRAGLDDPSDLLRNIVLDDIQRRRERSSKTHVPTTPSTPGAPWQWNGSPGKGRQSDLARSISTPGTPVAGLGRRSSVGSSYLLTRGSSESKTTAPQRHSSNSPPRPVTARQGSLQKAPPSRSGTPKFRRSSGSSGCSQQEMTPRHSSSDLLAMSVLPSSKWCFLRHLSLAENGLTGLTALSLSPVADTLQSFDLSGNLFSEIPDALASLTHLRALNLSNCMIDTLASLARNPLPAITTLNLRSNRLLSLAGIERLYSLERIDLRDNRLHDPTELARLTGIPDMTDLYVIKNPFTRTHGNYRTTIFNLFRASPGHVYDVTIDTMGPLYHEKKHLVDRVAEPINKPVVKPLPEDEPMESNNIRAEIEKGSEGSASPGHGQTTSDTGSRSTVRKKAPRRRIVDLAQAEQHGVVPHLEKSLPEPSAPNTPSTDDQPSTPEPTHSQRPFLAMRPKLDTAFTSQSVPGIRRLSDDDSSPVPSPADLEADAYRQKIVALKSELGPSWLSALNEERFDTGRTRNRSSSPASRGSTVRPERTHPGVSLGGRALG